ncbi:MAG TPA: putative Fe-S cluster assembly protein SufT [Candidatus Binatia bacterium]|nr:putative Fe-S cluster assembly protein SufT [Candidatus Binatia bacterium]
MSSEKSITVKHDCPAVMIPSGEAIVLGAGSTVWLTQALGGTYTVMTDRGYMARIDSVDGDAIGMAPAAESKPAEAQALDSLEEVEKRVWDQLRCCFDPEIPVNIVDLGLIYYCAVTPLADGGYKAAVRFTLTAQGCGMGQFLKADMQRKLMSVSGIREVDIELVWDPPWNQSRISGAAKQQLGIS